MPVWRLNGCDLEEEALYLVGAIVEVEVNCRSPVAHRVPVVLLVVVADPADRLGDQIPSAMKCRRYAIVDVLVETTADSEAVVVVEAVVVQTLPCLPSTKVAKACRRRLARMVPARRLTNLA